MIIRNPRTGVAGRAGSVGGVLRLYDADAAGPVEVRPAVRGLLRIAVSGGLRAYLVDDLLRRAAQRRGWRVAVVRHHSEVSAIDLGSINIHPAGDALPGGGADVQILGTTHDGGGSSAAEPAPSAAITATVAPAEIVASVGDPLAVRLALLAVPYRAPAEVSEAAQDDAAATLRRWRAHVAGWAEHPSRPMCAEYVQQVYAAFDDDLDTPTALRRLRALEGDPAIPAGSKFEAFVHLDRLLGLDLARDIGAASPPG